MDVENNCLEVFRAWFKELMDLAAKREYAEVHKHPERASAVETMTWEDLKERNWMANGVESIQLIWAIQQIEKELGIELYPTIFLEYQNARDLMDYLYSECGDNIRRWALSKNH